MTAETIDVGGPIKLILVCGCGQFMNHAGGLVLQVEVDGEPRDVVGMGLSCPDCNTSITVIEAQP